MKTWHILDFPDTVYVYLNNSFREEFFEAMFERVGGKRPYAKFLGLDQMTVKRYHQGCFYKKGTRYLQSIPIFLFKKSLDLMDNGLKEKLESNIHLLKTHGNGLPIINPKLPIIESPAFYRIVAHM